MFIDQLTEMSVPNRLSKQKVHSKSYIFTFKKEKFVNNCFKYVQERALT